MRFTVPQFIEHETKIVGPFTFRQFIYIGMAGAICFILYFSVPFSVFVAGSIIVGGGGLAFALLKIDGKTLPSILGSVLKFGLNPKIYIWRKKKAVIKILKKEKEPASVKTSAGKKETPLKMTEKSQLGKLKTKIETKTNH